MEHDRKAVPLAIDAKAAAIVTVKKAGEFEKGGVTVMTQAVAVKETGPKETVARFGEVYAFSPSFIAARRERPLLVRFWNLQTDDEHDFTLFDAKGRVLASIDLPPLAEVSYDFTFHKEGLFDFRCTIHQPGMNGQILVLPKE
jgi:plastocyanin